MSVGRWLARAIDERPANRLLLACGMIGPPLFVIVFLIEGATRPGYSAWRHYVSQLSLGEGGWLQIANFLVCGLLALCFALGLRRTLRGGTGATWGPLLLTVFGLGLVVAGIFVTDPALGYPPGAPSRPPGLVTHATFHGRVHGLAGLVVFSSVAAACFVLARRFADDPAWRGWAPYSVITGVLVAVFFIASLATAPLPGAPAGLLQRVAIIAGWGWIMLLAARLLGYAGRGTGERRAGGLSRSAMLRARGKNGGASSAYVPLQCAAYGGGNARSFVAVRDIRRGVLRRLVPIGRGRPGIAVDAASGKAYAYSFGSKTLTLVCAAGAVTRR